MSDDRFIYDADDRVDDDITALLERCEQRAKKRDRRLQLIMNSPNDQPKNQASSGAFAWSAAGFVLKGLVLALRIVWRIPVVGSMLVPAGLYVLLCLLCFAGHQSSCYQKGMMEYASYMLTVGQAMMMFSGFSGFKDQKGRDKPFENEGRDNADGMPDMCCGDKAGLGAEQERQVRSITQELYAKARETARKASDRTKDELLRQIVKEVNGIEDTYSGRLNAIEGKYVCWLGALSFVSVSALSVMGLFWLRVGALASQVNLEGLRLNSYGNKIAVVETRMNGHDADIAGVKTRLTAIEQAMEDVTGRMHQMSLNFGPSGPSSDGARRRTGGV
jgi:hypothetical protein